MKMRPLAALAMGIAIVAWGSFSSCSSTQMSQEMRQQERNMASENAAWQADVDRWKNENTALTSQVASKPVGSDSALAKHFTNLTEHTQRLASFEQDFQTHRGKVQEEAAMPEKDRITALAALWAEHSKLKIEHDLLAAAHEDLKGEQAQIVASSNTRP
jgi:hypothetical protein